MRDVCDPQRMHRRGWVHSPSWLVQDIREEEMTKEDAEQHAAVWRLAHQLTAIDADKSVSMNSKQLTSAILAAGHLAMNVATGYENMAKAIK